mgnify:CR=1 FL=1
MAMIGLMRLKFAPHKSDTNTAAFPTIDTDTGFAIGAIASLDIKLNNAEGEQYGDDVLQEYASEFTSADITAEVCDVTLDVEKKLYGLTQGASDSADEYYDGIGDNAPYGMLGGIQTIQRNGVKAYKGYIFTKTKAMKPDENGSTKSGSISFGTVSLKFKAATSANGLWRMRKEFETATAAEAWLDEKLKVKTTASA